MLGVAKDPRYTPTRFQTFPSPRPTDAGQETAVAGARVLDPEGAREAELKKGPLSHLYNQRPTWSAHLHSALDGAVQTADGLDAPDRSIPKEDILARLLALYLERTEAGTTERADAIVAPLGAAQET